MLRLSSKVKKMPKRFLNKTKSIAAAFAFATLTSATGASAASLTFDGWEKGYQSVNVTSPTHNGAAGGFRMKDVNTMERFTVFCLDLLAVIQSGSTYGYVVTNTPYSNSIDLIANGALGRIQSIFDSGYETAFDSSVKSAGFQVALWNAVYDDDWSVSAGAGDFYQTASNNGVRQAANDFLLSAQGYTGQKNWNMSFLESTEVNPRSQNLVTVSQVPLPAAIWVLLTALGGVYAVGRRKA